MVWVPLIFLYAYKIITQNKPLDRIKFAVSFASLLLSHNVMTLIFAPSLAIWCLFWIITTQKWRSLIPLILSGVWAVSLAAFFFIPVILESKFVHVESMTIGYFNYLAHFADAKQMFLSRFWGYGGSTWGPEDDMAFPIGHFHWILGFITTVFAIFDLKHHPKRSLMIIMLLCFGLLYAFLSHSRSVWFWDHLPLLYFAQFPWRLLAMAAFYFFFFSS